MSSSSLILKRIGNTNRESTYWIPTPRRRRRYRREDEEESSRKKKKKTSCSKIEGTNQIHDVQNDIKKKKKKSVKQNRFLAQLQSANPEGGYWNSTPRKQRRETKDRLKTSNKMTTCSPQLITPSKKGRRMMSTPVRKEKIHVSSTASPMEKHGIATAYRSSLNSSDSLLKKKENDTIQCSTPPPLVKRKVIFSDHTFEAFKITLIDLFKRTEHRSMLEIVDAFTAASPIAIRSMLRRLEETNRFYVHNNTVYAI